MDYLKTENSRVSPEHHQWAVEKWVTLDRDHDGFLTKKELDSKQFRAVVTELVHGSKQHVMVNVQGLIDWVRRKADGNHDGEVSFGEFEGFTSYLRSLNDKDASMRDAPNAMADLVFSMFDLNGNDVIDREEYREVDRFFRGAKPKEVDYEKEWASLDRNGDMFITRARYADWLREGVSQVMPAPSQQQRPDGREVTPEETSRPSSKSKRSPLRSTGLSLSMTQGCSGGKNGRPKSFTDGTADHPFSWNRRHHVGSDANELKPQGQRTYFGRPQSLPELRRYFETSQSSTSRILLERLDSEPEPRRKPIVSEDSGATPLDKVRHGPGGTMYNKTGELEPWNARWHESVSKNNDIIHKYHREYFDCTSVYAFSPSQKWRRMKDFQVGPGRWKPITEVRSFALEPEILEPEMEERDIRRLQVRLREGASDESPTGERTGCQSPLRRTHMLLCAVNKFTDKTISAVEKKNKMDRDNRSRITLATY